MAEQRLIDANNLGVGKANPNAFERKDYAYGWNNALQAVVEASPTIDPETLPVVRQLREELASVTAERDALKMNPAVEIQADAFALAVELSRVTAERDAAVEQLRGKCFACKHYTAYHNDGPCATCQHEIMCRKPWDAVDRWEWRGPQKEE